MKSTMPVGHDRNPWEQAQEHLQLLLDEHSYKNWFSQTRFESFEDGQLVVGVPSQFFADWLRDHYMDAVRESLTKVTSDFEAVSFVANAVGEAAIPFNGGVQPAALHGGGVAGEMHPAGGRRPAVSGLNPKYTFDRFVIGSSNRFAHAAALAVAESPGRAYNPLFLYGATGLGKTHLMQAIGHALKRENPARKCLFISSEEFTNQLIQSIAEKSTQRFRAKYRKVDVLLIDDIHFIAGKEATQEEFFHTFNVLFDMRKQIVISSDRSPKEIPTIEERLVSRFEWGLVTDIQPPDLETRIAILQSIAREKHFSVPSEVLRYIATYVTTNIRELEGAMTTVLAYSGLTEQKITLDMVEEVLRALIGSEKIKPITVDGILRAVTEHYDVRISDLRGRSRQRQIVQPRQMAMYLCKTLIPSMSLSDVGDAFGGKDHTTVLYACDKVNKESKSNPVQRQTVEQLTKNIRA